MVVVDPNHVSILDIGGNRLGKELVDLVVGSPGGFVKGDFTGVVVEERPKDLVWCKRCVLA